MIHQKILEELDKNIVSTFQETKGIPDTDEYELDERGVYVKKGTVKWV